MQTTLAHNPYTWNLVANMLYLTHPTGVGDVALPLLALSLLFYQRLMPLLVLLLLLLQGTPTPRTTAPTSTPTRPMGLTTLRSSGCGMPHIQSTPATTSG